MTLHYIKAHVILSKLLLLNNNQPFYQPVAREVVGWSYGYFVFSTSVCIYLGASTLISVQ